MKVSFPDQEQGGQRVKGVRVVDWEVPENNEFLISVLSRTSSFFWIFTGTSRTAKSKLSFYFWVRTKKPILLAMIMSGLLSLFRSAVVT